MAKSVKQQLSSLLGNQKKPNIFYKGLNTDVDEHLIGNDQYVDAVNVRINNKDGDFGTLQNLRSTHSAGNFNLTGWSFAPTTVANKLWFFQGGASGAADLDEIRFEFSDSTGASIINVDIDCTSSAFDWGNVEHKSDANDYTNSDLIYHCFEILRNDTTFTAAMTISLSPPINKGDLPALYFFPIDQTKLAGTLVLKSTYGGFGAGDATYTVAESANTYSETAYTSGSDGTFTLYPVGLVSFRDYIAAICWKATGTPNVNAVIKINTNSQGLISGVQPVVINDFGIASKTVSLKIEKIEENENFNRLYWTDGTNPVKTVNLDANAGFYTSFTEAADFNLFSKSPLQPITITNIRDTGNVNCGSWSYCYRLVTSDGKLSVFSPISNPVPLLASPKSQDYYTSVGGSIDSSSGKAVHLQITGVSEVYSKVQLIGIQYIDEDGGAAYFIIKEENISGDTVDLVHSGGETTTVITAEEVLTTKNTWDVCQDLAVKDNRLLAANLKNNAREIITDFSAFRVKSYKHTVAAANFITEPSSGEYQTYTGLNNPDLFDDILYKELATDTSHYRYAQAPGDDSGDTWSSKMVFGASTPNYHTDGDRNGVYVSFKLKRFELDKREMWDNPGGVSGNNDGHQNAPYYGPYVHMFNEPGGGWNNYKNPKFAKKYVGYMRDEIYRFGIQFFDKDGNQTFTYPVGDVRFPPIESDYRVIGTTGAVADFNATAGSVDSTTAPAKYILCDSNGNGWILYPEFRIKLHEDVRKNISGFNIVRAERTDADKRILAAGLMNQTLFHADHSDNGGMKNKVGLDKLPIFTQCTASGPDLDGTDYDFNTADRSEMYTLDSPDAMFGAYVYESTGSHKLRIASKFLCKSYPQTSKPSGGPSSSIEMSLTFDEDEGGTTDSVTFMRGVSSPGTFYAAPIYPSYTTEPDLGDVRKLCWYAKYYCQDGDSDLNVAANIGNQQHTILYGQNVGSGGVVSSANYTAAHIQDFVNSVWMYDKDDNINEIITDGSNIKTNSGNQLNGNTTIFLCMTDGNYFTLNTGVTSGFGDITLEGANYEAAKPYGKIINPITSSSGIYGGNTISAFEKTRWISTGAYVSINDISSTAGAETIVPVFGGDTYLNMFSISKFHKAEYQADEDYIATQGVVFPVESSINIDMRHGDFFGKNQANLQKEDEYLYNFTYSAQNNTKSFPSKDGNIKLVTDFKNVIAISNVKIAGQSEDAFSKFDATESFEVDANHGGVNNIINFRNNIYAIQERAVSILSINTRALIQSEDGSSIAIQSALGTGTVIERNDYISTKFGSQHRMNALSTDLGLYWYDDDNNTICEIDAKNPKMVVDLSTVKNCSNALNSLRKIRLSDNPLLLSTTNSGGINISYNPFFNEVMFSFSYYDSGALGYLNLCYDEAIGSFSSKRGYNTLINTTHREYLYSIGHKHGTAVASDSALRYTVYSHDSTATTYNQFYGETILAPYLEFINNEEVSSLKVFDKVSISFDGSPGTGIFSTFVYNTNIDAAATLDLTSNDIDKVVVGKQIVPIHKETGRFKGNYVKIKMTEAANTANAINVFSAITHYRKNII